MEEVIRYFSKGIDYQQVLNAHKKGIQEQLIAGLSGSSRSLFISTLWKDTTHSQLIITHNLHHAQKLYEDLIEWVGDDQVYVYPVNELISSEMATASPELRRQRIEVLNQLVEKKRMIVIVPLAGVRRLLPPIQLWKQAQLHFSWGDELELEDVQHHLLRLGYKRTGMVESQGEYSIRGGIIDVFSMDADQPVRLELFDTEIDSIRRFDAETQKSIESLQEVRIGPSVEWILNPEHYQYGLQQIEPMLADQIKQTKNKVVREKLEEHIGWEIEQLKNETSFEGIYKYISCFYGQKTTLIDYMPLDTAVIMDEPARIFETEVTSRREEAEWQTSLLQVGEYLPDLQMSIDFSEWQRKVKHQILYLSLFLRQIPHTSPGNIVHFSTKPMQQFHGQFSLLEGEITRWKKSKQAILFLASDADRAKRMHRVLDDFGIRARVQKKNDPILIGDPLILVRRIQSGFELPLHSLVVITEDEVFSGGRKKKSRKSKTISNAERIKNYNELSIGDYVVHINHGIGKYVGIETLEIDGLHKDYLHVKYAGNDNLYVPVDQIDQVQKYVGSEEKDPRIHSLGGSEWKKVKKKVRSSVQDIAGDLIKLYAKRQARSGYSFSPDTEMHADFASLFPYQETEDQLRSIDEVRDDMEKPQPMDRLLCGDVGYGKTEVAIRAAFKSVMDGKQVAVLVPTTILAQQHHETFRERFQDYPVQIDTLSRFRSRKEQNQTIKNIKSGVTDIVIGTHRLLSKDLQFKDLGLLVVDEEQRFGVSHKEKIKQLKENVDVLTLTATPIPRTLHMSMLGVRDLSVIETPPENRFPVQTYVLEYNGALTREAIEREMARGGQVYFLYNQVQGIERKAEEIRALVPDARVAIAHGQMKEAELEAVMIDFLEGDYDVLVSTTIIETGVDIPNVNTLIIHNADKMGLSQLYQLRGRVGRSNRTAYAYFTYQRGKVLTEVAEKRLQSIKEFTELGSGFKIAMRDLSIRGAGNLLGAEQHGFIHSVGFDLYSQMLKEAIDELKGEKTEKEKVELEVDIQVDAYIPEGYIDDGKQKIEMYKKVAAITTVEEVNEMEDEFTDRFGTIPHPVWRLLMVSKLKAYAYQLKIESIVQSKDGVKMMFAPSQNDKIDGSRLFKLVNQWGRKVGLISGASIGLTVKTKGMAIDEWLEIIEKLLAAIIEEQVLKGDERIEGEEKHALP